MQDESRLAGRRVESLQKLSRRRALALLGTASFAGVSSVPASANGGNGQGNGGNGQGNGDQATADINVLSNPNFITNARDEAPPFDDDTALFDPGPVSVPLKEIIDGSEEYDSELFRSLNDGKHQIVEPPEGYDREAGYDDPWEPITWGSTVRSADRRPLAGSNRLLGTAPGATARRGPVSTSTSMTASRTASTPSEW